MPRFVNRKQLQKATDEEIERFFAETVFEGIYSSELKSKNSEFYKGSITDIKLNGRPTNLVMTFLNVPHTSNSIPEGPCSFKCRMNIAAFRTDESKYSVNLIGSSLRAINSLSESNIVISAAEIKEQDLFDMWGVDDCQCIGYYHYDDKSEVYIVDDLRKPNFDHIPYYPGDSEKKPIRISCPHEIRGIELNDYYLFSWKLSHRNKNNPYEIYLDFKTQPKPIDPKWFVDTLFDDRHNDKSKNFGSATNFLDTLSKQLSAKESTFVYELLQNANDYPVDGRGVDVEFHITDNYLLFLHSGDKFNVRNISGICGINEKEKVANKKTIGYKGIGFKTVFLNNHYVYLRTGDYSFRFDEGETPEKKFGGKIKRLGAPFQILPIWTNHNEVAKEVNDIFDKSSREFRVQIALRPNNKNLLHIGRNCYENLFREIFSDSNIILFIPNINSVRVFINGQEERACFRNNEEWIVGEYENEIKNELQILINKTIDKGNSRIPEKYKDFDYTKVSFACKHEGAIIKPVDDATLYCYLPTRASWGLPFLMNTDMIPKGDRNDIETEVKLNDENETNFNEELASIAGSKLFLWVRDLLTSRKYQLGSVFSLVPDFEQCKREHKDYSSFIERFEEAFNTCLETETIVPVPQGIALVNKVIFDTTGLSTSGIMTDDEFRKFTCMEDYYLPFPMLRKDKHFNSFLKRYAEDEQKFEVENLTDLIANEDFQEWLKNQDNNNKFLNFLLEREYLQDLKTEEIFLEANGELFCASDLFYDIDKYLIDLKAFTNHLCYLSPKTREFFKDNKAWEDVIEGEFVDFNCNDFVDNTLLSTAYIADTKKALADKNTSVHFYKFLAENVGYSEAYKALPFFDDNNASVDNFSDSFVFLSSEKGHAVCGQQWMQDISVSFLSKDYKDVTKKYFCENFGVRNYSDEIIVKEIILSEDHQPTIKDSITDMDSSKEFIKYCFANRDFINTGGLKDYNLHVYDGDGDEEWTHYGAKIFFPSSLYDAYSTKEWIGCDWMYVLDDNYFTGIADKKELKEFFDLKFYVSELTEESFYVHVVRENLPKIIKATCGSEDGDGKKNIDFILYLDENYKMIFEDKRDAEKFNGFKPVSNDFYDLDISSSVYVYDDALADIIGKDWFPKNTIYLCNKEVGKSPSLIALGCSKYTFSSFYNDVIVEELPAINDTITTKEQSLAFHSFIIDNLRHLTTEQLSAMVNAKVYLYGNDIPANSAKGHKILSAKAKELFEKGLVDFSDLDIIDPIYKTEENTEYWENRLENSKFNITHFFSWLKENAPTFSNTLQDKEKNVVFWRWLKENATDKVIGEIPTLPVILKKGNVNNSNDTVYFSDEYMGGAGIESSVNRFDPDAPFISPIYIADGEDVEEWKSFWSKKGIRYEIIDILTETIIPSLSDIEDESLPKLIAENREALERYYGNELIAKLTGIKVKVMADVGGFYTLDKTIYIDCEKDEPFPYIILPNQIAFNSADERRLIKDIIDEVEGDCVSKLSEWQQRKMDCYLSMQKDNPDSVRDFHFRFINDLSVIRNNEKETLKAIERIKEIKLLNKNNEFCEAASLTMGSVYNPFFDFEGCGVKTDYVSDKYNKECSEYAGKLFRLLDIHCDFKESDVEILKDRECAVYFWSKYLTRKDISISRIKDIIDKKLLHNLPCIPTKDYMRSPTELYYGSEVSKYVKYIEDWENKIPLTDLPDIKQSNGTTLFEELPFKKSLDFLDGLYALISVFGQERRTQILEWMIEDYDESYSENVSVYREDEHALWFNNKNEQVQIKELYALNYTEKTLEQYFGQNPRIVNKAYFPGGPSFKTACDILGIQTISLSDLKMEPFGDMIFTQKNNDLKLFALVIAGMIDTEGWQELYKGYLENLEKLVLHRCKSIMITYKEDETINQSLRKFYHETGSNDFYFVDSLDGKRVYTLFVKEFTEFIGIKKDEIPQEMIEDIMDSRANALNLIREQNTLMLDDAFKDALDELIPGIKRELNGNKADDDDEETPVTYRPTFTTSEPNDENMDDEDEVDNVGSTSGELSDDGPGMNNDSDESYDSSTNTTESQNGTESHSQSTEGNSTDIPSPSKQTDDNSEVKGQRMPRSDKGGTHDYPSTRELRERKSPTNTTPTKAGEGTSNYSDMNGWEGSRGSYTPQVPKPFSPEDVRNFGSHGVTRTLEVLEPTTSEVAEINRILGEDLSPEQVADQNYLAQLRLYNNLVKRGMTPNESKDDFVRNAHMKNEHTINGGKYIHKCSAAGGIMYLSPSIWNKIADDRCVVCVYLGAKSNEFMYFNSIDDILEWVGEDDIVIKLTGEEKADVVEELYSGVLNGVKGTAYTLIRINSNEKYNSLFAQLPTNNDINETEENLDEYDD